MKRDDWIRTLHDQKPRVHCLTNPVTMQDVANILLAAGGSAIMAQNPEEVEDITAICQATLLNTGVPDEEKIHACILAGKKANELGHPVVLDPVGAGASVFRRTLLGELLENVDVSLIRCNQEEACTLLHLQKSTGLSGGVESAVTVEPREQEKIARKLAKAYGCTAFITGRVDVISDGEQTEVLSGGDDRIARITGSGCMLSALCALFCGADLTPYEAAWAAGIIWKESSREAGLRTDECRGGIGSFHVYLFDALDWLCHGRQEE